MKKALFILTLTLLSFPLFSSVPIYSGITDTSYRPTTFRFKAMGEAGRAIPKREEVFYVNAAGLADDKKFFLSIPTFSLTGYHISTLFNAPYKEIENGNVDAITDTLSKIKGNSPLLVSNQAISTSFLGFGTSLNFEEGLYLSGPSVAVSIIPLLDSSLSLGYGYRWDLGNEYKIDAGFMTHFSGVFYSSEVNLSSALAIALGNNTNLSLVSSSWAFSLDLGLIASFPHNLYLAFTLDNLGGYINLLDKESKESTKIYTPFQLNLAFAWQEEFSKFFSLGFAADLIDITSLFTPSFSFSSILYSLNLGLEMNFSTWFGVYLGLKGGFPSAGLKLQLLNFRITALYRIQEFGKEVGINPTDQLELGVNLVF